MHLLFTLFAYLFLVDFVYGHMIICLNIFMEFRLAQTIIEADHTKNLLASIPLKSVIDPRLCMTNQIFKLHITSRTTS
uniref:Uncharacterized protein n=1 Tax=Solanum lycopersicum TaxID=4081 RepID=A0A3Q7EB48_SOLLC